MTLGTAVKISATLSTTPNSISAETYDQMGALKNTGAMANESGNTYVYIMQSSASWKPGKYKTIVSAIIGAYTTKDQIIYTLD